MKRLLLLALIASAVSAQTNNGNQVNAGGVESGGASYTRPQTGNGAPPSAECNNAISITSSTNASPIVVTKAAHGLTTGQTITLYQHATNTAANGTWQVLVVNSSTFQLCGYVDSASVCQNPSTGNGVGGATGYFSTQVGRVFVRNNPGVANQSIYACADTAGGSPGWSLQGPSTTDRYRECDITFGDTSSSSVLTNAQLGPQVGICFIPEAATVIEVDVRADGGTPNIILAGSYNGSVLNLTSSALATGSSGARACSNTGGTTGLDGLTTCSSTLQNTSLAAGTYVEAVSGTAGGTAKWFTAHVIYSAIN